MAIIYDSPDFRACEAAWRGLQTMVKQASIKEGEGIKVTLAPVSPAVLADVLNRAAEELDDPPGLVLIDLPFDASPVSTELLNQVAEFADNQLMPTAYWVGPGFFHLGDWSDLKKVQYLAHFLEDAGYAKWRKVKELPGASWMVQTVNRFLVRLPYGKDNPPKGAHFSESEPLWISPVWALGTLAAKSTLEFGWPSRFTDYRTISLTEMPLADYSSGGPSATEMLVDEDRLVEFLETGFTPIMGPLRKDVVFIPKEATLAGGSLKYQLFVSRILGFFFWAKENLGEDIGAGDPAAGLTAAFSQYWEKTGHTPPEDLSIKAGPPAEGGVIPLTVNLTPPTSVLPGGQGLEFTFGW